jgi:UDP-N-acetylglucosamine:LPS N-acetylglucosamine transferase
VRSRRPAIVVAMGGYASVPCAAAAVVLGVPVVVHEQNAVPGLANRLVARFSRAAAVSFEGTNLPRATVTGNPVRPEMLAVDRDRDRADARKRLGLPNDRAVVGVFGGSLGARRINETVLRAVELWARRRDLAIRHIVGRRDWAIVGEWVARFPGGSDVLYQPVEFESRMDLVLAAADLVVCRAGATSVAELAVVGVPSLLVPLPGAPGDHQTANARYLERAGAAVVVPDSELEPARLVEIVDAMLTDRDRLTRMAYAARSGGRRDAAKAVARLVEQHALVASA